MHMTRTRRLLRFKYLAYVRALESQGVCVTEPKPSGYAAKLHPRTSGRVTCT